MTSTVIPVNDAKAVNRWSASLFVDIARESFYDNTMVGQGENAMAPFIALTDLESKAGDTIKYDLNLQLKGRPVHGDTRITGTEEGLRFASDEVKIDLIGKSVSAGRTMSQKRTLHSLRSVGRDRQRDYWARLGDEYKSIYLSGARGINEDFVEGTDFTGFAGNAIAAPSASHHLFGGSATAFNGITSADVFDLRVIDRAKAISKTMGGGSTNIPRIRPMKFNGKERFVCVMHPFQEYSLRTSTATSQWLDIQKAAAGAEGQASPIFRGGLGMYNDTVLQVHDTVIRFNTAGASTDLPAARALFMGRQAGVIAWGSPGSGQRIKWREDLEDRGRELVITAEQIIGVKKTRFTVDGTARDFGVMAIDTYAAPVT
jgi:N4-gp56 family major capsid protein